MSDFYDFYGQLSSLRFRLKMARLPPRRAEWLADKLDSFERRLTRIKNEMDRMESELVGE